MPDNNSIRLQKFLSQCGVSSRRAAEQLILQGKVLVNGRPVQLGCKIHPKKDIVLVNGKRIDMHKTRRYIMLYKPRGFVTTMHDELGRKSVDMLVANVGERVFPIGRLDKNSEGLLLFTNDGSFANMLSHPRCHVSKTYRVTIRPPFGDAQLHTLISGVRLDDGYVTQPADVSVAVAEDTRIVLLMTIYEGKNRQIRKMCEACDLEIQRLQRVAIGGVEMGDLRVGAWKHLTPQQLEMLGYPLPMTHGHGTRRR